MSGPRQRRHSLPNISSPSHRSLNSTPNPSLNLSLNTPLTDQSTPRSAPRSNNGLKTPSTARQPNNAPITAPTKLRRHSLAQPPTFGGGPSNRRLSPLPEQQPSNYVTNVSEITVSSLVESYLRDADMHLKLGKIPDGSSILASVLSEMKLEKNDEDSGNDDSSNIYDVIGPNSQSSDIIGLGTNSESSDEVFSDKSTGSIVTGNGDEVESKVNVSPKHK